MVNLYIIYIFILFTLSPNVWMFFRLRKKLTNWEIVNYLYLLLSISGWAIANAGADTIRSSEIALLFAQISILFPLNIINALLRIVSNFPRIIERRTHSFLFKISNIITGVFTIISLIFLTSSLNIQNFQIQEQGAANFTPGYLYYALTVFSLAQFLFIVFYWKKRFNYYTPIQKRQVVSILGALIFVYFSMIAGLVVLPLLGQTIYGPFMFLSLALLLFIINKSLWVKVVVVDILEEIAKLSGILVSSIIIVAFWALSGLADSNLNLVAKFLISIIVIVLINYIYSRFQNIYINRRSKSQDEVRRFIDLSTSLIQFDDTVREIKTSLSKILETNNIVFELINDNLPFHKLLLDWWKLRSRIPIINREVLIESYFDRENNKEITKQIYNYLQSNSINILIPVTNQDTLIALIQVHKTDGILNESDYSSLSLLANGISVSVNRTLLYQELQVFNKTLQQKVNEQTKELQIKVKELEEARRKEADMIDIMGHELRTPATVVKLNADLLHKFIDKIPEDKESFSKYVTRIKDAVENEINLINTLLSSAKLEGDKIEINPESVDIYSEIDMAIHGEERNAKEKGLSLINHALVDTPLVFADKARTVEILNNLISNAVKYTENGSVSVSTEDLGDFIRISVVDTGRGISQEDIQKLGTKFFRTKTYIQSELSDDVDIVRPGGTGLGLYVTFNLVRKMGGDISVQSELGKGSIFSFTLPKYTNQDSKATITPSYDMFERLGLRKQNESL